MNRENIRTPMRSVANLEGVGYGRSA
jgi:hypothetical protein